MIEISDLYFSYSKNEPYLLNNINLNINKGDYISLLGENGCGKSTLIKLILKILTPTKGSINFNSTRIGYVPQRFENFNSQFPLTVYEMLNCYKKSCQIKEKGIITKYLKMLGMYEYRNSLIGTLSGGQSQKLFIARALMGEPEILVLDEPSNGIDIASQKEIYGLIKNLNRTNGITVISVEHNLKAAVTNSTVIYHLNNGYGHLCKPENYIKEYVSSNAGGSTNATTNATANA